MFFDELEFDDDAEFLKETAGDCVLRPCSEWHITLAHEVTEGGIQRLYYDDWLIDSFYGKPCWNIQLGDLWLDLSLTKFDPSDFHAGILSCSDTIWHPSTGQNNFQDLLYEYIWASFSTKLHISFKVVPAE